MDETIYTDEQICAKCVDENEVIFDEHEEFVKMVYSVDIECPEELNQEVLKNITTCSSVLLMYMKQRIIANEPRVRYHPANDIYGLKRKIFDTGLSDDVRKFFQNMSEIGCKILQESSMLDTLVELDSERPGKVVAFGKTLNMVGYADILVFASKDINSKFKMTRQITDPGSNEASECPSSLESQTTSGIGDQSESTKPSKRHRKSNKTAKCSTAITKTTKNTASVNQTGNVKTKQEPKSITRSYTDQKKSTQDIDATKATNNDDEEEMADRAVITVAVTAGNSLSAAAVYKQLLLSYLQTLSRFYFLVLHIGPLVDKQRIALYEYVPSQKLTDLIQSYDGRSLEQEDDNTVEKEFVVSLTVQKTSSLEPATIKEPAADQHYLDVSEIERCFREVKGNRIQMVTGLKQYFRYMFSDCPGVKDHVEDKRNRYERNMANRERKKQKKRKSRKHEASDSESSVTESESMFTFFSDLGEEMETLSI